MNEQADITAIRTLYDTYFDAWNRKDLATLAGLFGFPMLVGGGGREPAIVPDAASYRARMQAILDDLESRGWTRSVLDECHVGLMAGDTGVITVHYHRDRADGSELEGGTSNYLTRKLGGQWKIVGMLVP